MNDMELHRVKLIPGPTKTDEDNDYQINIEECSTPLDGTVNNKSPFALAWINLTFCRKSAFADHESKILNNLRGRIDFGTISALMGPSGSGKTTLLRCLNGVNSYVDGLSFTTELYVSNQIPIKPCFIVQDVKEHLLMSLTVRESLIYASRLKNKGIVNQFCRRTSDLEGLYDDFNHMENIKSLLVDLLLVDCADNSVSRCSGGEQKRLIIAMELTPRFKPNLICIDEPTSGLDSNAAEQTILCLQNIARKHFLAIVTSIHQPNNDVLRMFDLLYVLAKGGRCLFSGVPRELRQHLHNCNIKCEEDDIAIEILLKISSRRFKTWDNEDDVMIELGPPEDVVSLTLKTYEKMSTLKTDCMEYGKRIASFTEHKVHINTIDLWHLLCRCIKYSWIRQWKIVLAQLAFLLMFALVMVNVYRDDIGTDGYCFSDVLEGNVVQTAIDMREETLPQQNLKFLFFLTILILFIQLNATVLTFPQEMKIFLNEHRNHWYSSGSYFWTKTLVDIPIVVITAYFYCWIGYWGSSQPDMTEWYDAFSLKPKRFVLLTALVIMGLMCAQGIAIIVGILFAGNFRLAAISAIALFLVNILYSGFFIPLKNMGDVIKAFAHLTFLKDYFEAILVVIYGRKRCFLSISLVLLTFDVEEDDFWANFWIIFGHMICYRLIAVIILMMKANGTHKLLRFMLFR